MSKVRNLPELLSFADTDLIYAVESAVNPNGGRKATIATLRSAILTAAAVKAAYESNPDTNAFTDADKAKLDVVQNEYVTSIVSGRVVHYEGGQIHYKGVLYKTLPGDILLNASITNGHIYVDVDGTIKQTGSNSPAPKLTFPVAKFSTDLTSIVSLEDHRVFIDRNLDAGDASNVSTIFPDSSSAAGSIGDYADIAHVHPIFTDIASTQTPDQANAEGISTSFSRADHIHQLVTAAPLTTLSPAVSNAQGSATSFSRSDHTHAIATALVGDISTIQPDDAAAAGVANTFARGDHKHAIVASAPSTQNPDQANAEGVGTSFARADHIHNIPTAAATGLNVNSTNTQGSGSNFARADHTHAIASGAPSTQNPDQANAAGSSANFAKADHIHNIPAAAPTGVATNSTNTKGISTSFALADHVHQVTVANQEATATADDTTMSTTDTLMNSMTITPVAGTYWIIWHGSILNSANGSERTWVSLYSGGSQVSATERSIGTAGGAYFPAMTGAVVTVNGSQAIELRWRVAGGTSTVHSRRLSMLRIG